MSLFQLFILGNALWIFSMGLTECVRCNSLEKNGKNGK